MGESTGGGGIFNMRDLGVFIRDVGFPIVVAIFLLVQLPKLNEILVDLRVTLQAVGGAIHEQTRQLQAHRLASEGPSRDTRDEEEGE